MPESMEILDCVKNNPDEYFWYEWEEIQGNFWVQVAIPKKDQKKGLIYIFGQYDVIDFVDVNKLRNSFLKNDGMIQESIKKPFVDKLIREEIYRLTIFETCK